MQAFLDFAGTSTIFVARASKPLQLKCPRCKREATIDRPLTVDADIRCPACGDVSEFRQFREAWCESRRPKLRLACPELHYANDRRGGF